MATTLRFMIVGDDQASPAFSKFARTAGEATRAVDKSSAALMAQSKTARVAADASIALAKTDKILRDASLELAVAEGRVTRAQAEQARSAEQAAVKTKLAGEAAAGAGSGFASLGSPMVLAAGAAATLAPIAVTLGLGLGGLGLAALAASKDTQAMATVLGPLKADLKQFDASLKPEVLALFGDGAGIARQALHGLQPVARETGIALHGVLGEVSAEFRSGEWQSFFSFMQRQAGPDVRLLGNLFVDLTRVLPQLLTQLQPAGTELLQAADAVVKLVGGIEHLNTATNNLAAPAGRSAGVLGILAGALKNAAIHAIPGVDASELLGKGLNAVSSQAPGAAAGVAATGDEAGKAAPKVATLAQQVNHLGDAYNNALSPMLTYTNAQITQANDAATLSAALKVSHGWIGLNTAAQRASFGDATQYIQSLLNTASAAGKSGQGIDAQISAIKNALPLLQHVKGGTHDYWAEVQQLVGWLDRLKAEKSIVERVTVFGNGQWTRNATTGPGSVGGGHQLAAGGLVSGGIAGRDSVAALLTPGEVVVPASMVRAGAVDHLRGILPGFAAGGIVPTYAGLLAGLQPWAAANRSATIAEAVNDIASAMAKAFAASVASASAGFPGGPALPGSSAAVAQRYAASIMGLYGWDPAYQMPALISLWNGESGWNYLARNPSSGAYGIPQALPASKMAAAGADWLTNYATQVRWGEGYIRQAYGSPQVAYARWLARSPHWYADGVDAVFSTPTVIGVAERGPERVTVTPRGRGGGGDTYVTNHVTVNAPPGTHPAQLGKEIARYLKEYENINGISWRTP